MTRLEAAAERYKELRERLEASCTAHKKMEEQVKHLEREMKAESDRGWKLREELDNAAVLLHAEAMK